MEALKATVGAGNEERFPYQHCRFWQRAEGMMHAQGRKSKHESDICGE